MDQLLPVINKLQDVMASVGPESARCIDLPQIAVVGSQSAGKSSVLESIVGRDFLPRGQGIVTRRPLILQLRHNSVPIRGETTTDDGGSESPVEAAAREPKEYGEFGHIPNKKFTNFDEIRDEIQSETDRVAGKEKGINHKPILLQITSPYVIDLTLVDLPGLTKNPVGDQPADIESQIREMICSFVEKPNCLILAVTPAITDLATSDALQIAREADPQGERTIGVLTKCDLMEEGTSVDDILDNQIYPLRLGYVAVVCRSQKDIKDNTPIREALVKEREFFEEHCAYKPFLERCGTANLALLLNEILLLHIQRVLPVLRNKLQEQIHIQEALFKDLGEPSTDPLTQRANLLQFFTDFAHQFANAIEGRNVGSRARNLQNPKPQTTLEGGARINYIFHEWFGASLMAYDPLSAISEEDIRVAIRNSTGPRAALFASEGAFEDLVRRQIMQLEAPAVECVEKVYSELKHIVERCEIGTMSRLPNLRRQFMKVIDDMLRGCLAPTVNIVHSLIKMELSYCNTNHPDFPRWEQLNDVAKLPGFGDAETSKMQISNLVHPQLNQHKQSQLTKPVHPINVHPINVLPDYYTRNTQPAPSTAPRSSSTVLMPEIPLAVRPLDPPNMREQSEIRLIKYLLEAYFNIVRKNIMDLVPKAIMTFMVNEAKANVQQELTKHLFREDLIDVLMSESEDVIVKRRSCRETLKILRTAMEIMDSIRNYSFD